MAEKQEDPKQLTLELDEKPNPTSSKRTSKEVAPASSSEKKASGTTNPKVKESKSEHERPNPKPGNRSLRDDSHPSPHIVQRHSIKAAPAPIASKQPPATSKQKKAGPPATKKRSVPSEKSRDKSTAPPFGNRKGYVTPLKVKVLVALLGMGLALAFTILVLTLISRGRTAPVDVSDVYDGTAVAVTIEKGMSARSVSLLLEQRQVVQDAQALLAYFVENNLTTSLKSGSYLMYRGMAFEEIGQLLSSDEKMAVLTIPPGYTLKSIDLYLANRLGISQGEFLKTARTLAHAYGLNFAEGWLLCGRYEVKGDHPAQDLALKMYQAMLAEVQKHLGSPLLQDYSVEQLLIIASMIQAETQDASQMPGISSVIHNRLKNNEPLGIDATTRYELDDWINPIPTEALETKSPYNTRRKAGLPPTGISSPSIQAVHAAFHPSDTPYFYYLHDTNKQIHFARTYEEHKENIKRYR